MLQMEAKLETVLGVHVKLDDGRLAPACIVDTSPGTQLGRYICNICCAVVGSSHNLLEHVRGKNHKRNMNKVVHPAATFGKLKGLEPKCVEVVKPTAPMAVSTTAPLAVDVPAPFAVAPFLGHATAPLAVTTTTAPTVPFPSASLVPELVDLAPGEPVPPGFEDVVTQLPEISSRLDLMKASLLGLEFLAEVTPRENADSDEPRYLCMLCDKKGDKRTVLAHLISFNHRIRYMSRFFPRTIGALEAIPKLKEYRRGTGEVLTMICQAVEAKFGRMVPCIIEEEEFEKQKSVLFQTMMNGPHFTETPQCNFEAMVKLDFIKEISQSEGKTLLSDAEIEEAKLLSATARTGFKHNSPPPKEDTTSDVPEKKSEDTKNKKKKKEMKEKDKNGPSAAKKRRELSTSPFSSLSSFSGSRSRSRSKSRSRSRSRSRHRRRVISPPRRRALPYRRTHSRSRSRSIGRYRRGGSPYRYRSPRRSPPRRSPNRRSPYRRPPPSKSWAPIRPVVSFKIKQTPVLPSRELEEEKEKKEKIRQLRTYSKALNDEMAQKLKSFEKTPEKHPLYSEEWKKFWNKRYKELTAEGKDATKHDFKPEWIKFWTTRIKELNEEELKTRLKTFRSELGLPDEDLNQSDDDEVVEVTPAEVKATAAKEKEKKELIKEDVETSVMHVLRLLAALEDQLGSLGPKVNNLLSQALTLDKIRKGGAETLLDHSDNVVLFETVKEKLKGQLFAGVVDKQMIRGTKKAISAVVELFAKQEERKKELATTTTAPCEPLIVPGVGAVDKMAIAAQIASALVAQGRTDLSEDDLEQLINAVVGMAQVSHAVAQAGKTPEPAPAKVEKSSLQDLLSSVVRGAKGPNNSLQLIQDYEEVDTSPSKSLTIKEMSQLSDHDLKTLLQNFRGLSRDEQQFLISYLKELEAKDAANVAKLRSFINFDDSPGREMADASGRLSPFSSRVGGSNPTSDKPQAMTFEDDEDDYTFEDIFKAAKKNVKIGQAAAKKASEKDLVQKMIQDQEKKVSDLKSAKPSVVIDPNDLFSGMTAATTSVTETAVKTPPVVAIAPSNTNSINYTDGTNSKASTPQPTSTSVAQDPVPVLPATSLGPLMTAAPINPAPQPLVEAPHSTAPTAWDGYNLGYTEQQPYAYPEASTYTYTTEQPVTYQQEQYHQDVWPDQGYQQHDPYAPSNGYNYAHDNYSVPPPTNYETQPPPSQYPGYY